MNVTLPLTTGWFNGQEVLYISIDESDPADAKNHNVNSAPSLASAANTGAVDDIYVFTNFKQGNVIASAPEPVGPNSTNSDYSPLWQVNMVTWSSEAEPQTLTSEKDIKDAEAAKQVTIKKTDIIANCPVISTHQGGNLPNATIEP